jgi:nucleoside-diphosphate-sugar epimerase
MISKSLKKTPRIQFLPWRPSDQKVYISDISKIKNELGWQPQTGIKAGIAKLTAWLKENQKLFND